MKRCPAPIIGIKPRSQAPPGRAPPEQNRLFLEHVFSFLTDQPTNQQRKNDDKEEKKPRRLIKAPKSRELIWNSVLKIYMFKVRKRGNERTRGEKRGIV